MKSVEKSKADALCVSDSNAVNEHVVMNNAKNVSYTVRDCSTC